MDDMNEDFLPTEINLTGEGVSEGNGTNAGPDGENVYEVLSEGRAKGQDGRLQLKYRLAHISDGEPTGMEFNFYLNLPAKIGEGGKVVEDAEWAAQWAGMMRALYTDLPERPTFDKSTKKSYLGEQELNKTVANELRSVADKATRAKLTQHYSTPGLAVGKRFRAQKTTSDKGYPRLGYFAAI